MTAVELRLARHWYAEDGVAANELTSRLGRANTTVSRALRSRAAVAEAETRDRPVALTAQQIDRLIDVLNGLVQKSEGKRELTVAIPKRSARSKANAWSICRALHSRGVHFRRMRTKPILTKQGEKGPAACCAGVRQEAGGMVAHGGAHAH